MPIYFVWVIFIPRWFGWIYIQEISTASAPVAIPQKMISKNNFFIFFLVAMLKKTGAAHIFRAE